MFSIHTGTEENKEGFGLIMALCDVYSFNGDLTKLNAQPKH
jgi:hypothetical protein